MATPALLPPYLLRALEALFLSEDNEGCSDDLTVVSKRAVENLRKIYNDAVKD